MSFESYFRVSSYSAVAAAALALFIAGGVGAWLAIAFGVVLVGASKLEDTRWQLSERVALGVILVSLPLFYVDWRILASYVQIQYLEFGGPRVNAEIAVLGHMILFLSAVKLLQAKADRDWFFLYLISFFEVLLAAGLSVSPAFLATLTLYLLCALSTVMAFEIRKSRGRAPAAHTRLLITSDSTVFRRRLTPRWQKRLHETRRLPLVSLGLLLMIALLALPFFLVVPRTTLSALSRSGSGLGGFIGFSDHVTLGDIGRLKSSDEIVMRVRVEDSGAQQGRELRWRGVALDRFTGRSWIKSANASVLRTRDERPAGFFQLGTTEDLRRLTAQTFFMEPLDTPVLFAAPRAVAMQGALPFVRVDGEGSLQTRMHDQERIIYKVYSDTAEPDAAALRGDSLVYPPSADRYKRLPDELDPRIAALARDVMTQSAAHNRYDQAHAIETYLWGNYGYTLDLKAGGPDPLSDFLFNVRAGHCEYFATAMAVMLRTQGIAARVVNGFLPGERNEAANAYTVRKSDAHSWVEVYFPKTDSWVTFDPTPAAGRIAHERTGLAGQLSKYSEALELMWFQYVIGYDKKEQRSLATSLHNWLFDLRRGSAAKLDQAQRWLASAAHPALWGLLVLVVLLLCAVLASRMHRLGWRVGLKIWRVKGGRESSRVDFYDRLIALLEKRGLRREEDQTPLEFAAAVGISEAIEITSAYNRVRFGGENLSRSEVEGIEDRLCQMERTAASVARGQREDAD
jgi:transglutaminase-like putative cysteine protease